MNNSEIIAVIMQKNKKSGISEIQKYRLLHLVAKYGTAADLKEYFEKYGVPPCCGEAYAHAFQYDDKEKIVCKYSLICDDSGNLKEIMGEHFSGEDNKWEKHYITDVTDIKNNRKQ